MTTHDECIQGKRISILETDVRALAKATNGKLDRIWVAVDKLQDQAATSRANWKLLGILAVQIVSFAILIWRT